jgi:hypothetical protein
MITGLPPTPLVSGSGNVFAAVGSSLAYTADATSVTITPELGTEITIPAATDTVAGMLDAARAAIIDNLAPVALSGSFSDLSGQPDRSAIVTMIFDGGGSALVAPFTRYLYMPFAATITGWALMADQTGSISIDIWKVPSANFPPLVGNSITGGSAPSLSSQSSAFATSIPGSWSTTQIDAGDCLAYRVTSAATVQVVTFELTVTH